MKRLLLVVIFGVLFPLVAVGQTREVGRFELEIGGGIALGSGELDDLNLKWDKNNPGYSLHAELRYNFARLPLDIGARFSSSFFNRDLGDIFQNADFKAINLMGFVDYNLFRKSNISLFIGAGFGYAGLDTSHLGTLDDQRPGLKEFIKDNSEGAFCMMPRIGVEFFHRLRLTAGYLYQGNAATNHFDISLGFVFGGGKR